MISRLKIDFRWDFLVVFPDWPAPFFEDARLLLAVKTNSLSYNQATVQNIIKSILRGPRSCFAERSAAARRYFPR